MTGVQIAVVIIFGLFSLMVCVMVICACIMSGRQNDVEEGLENKVGAQK